MLKKQEPSEAAGGDAAATVKERLCPECEGKLVPRTSKFGPFYGCSNYPKCRHHEKS